MFNWSQLLLSVLQLSWVIKISFWVGTCFFYGEVCWKVSRQKQKYRIWMKIASVPAKAVAEWTISLYFIPGTESPRRWCAETSFPLLREQRIVCLWTGAGGAVFWFPCPGKWHDLVQRRWCLPVCLCRKGEINIWSLTILNLNFRNS